MFEAICKAFIRDYKDHDNEDVRKNYGTFFSILSIVCNLILVLFKYVISFLNNSFSIRADALNNLSDAASNLATLFGFRLASKHSDSDHPYGHGRMEYVAGMIVSFFILLSGVDAIRTAIRKILAPEELHFSFLSVIVLLVSMAVKGFMSSMNRKAGQAISSETLLAAGKDSRNDVFLTGATLLSILSYHYFHLNIDAVIGLFVSLMVLKTGIDIFRTVLDTILGKAPDKEEIASIRRDILAHQEILGIHDLLIHDYGPSHRFMSLHAEVDGAVPIMETHDVIDRIENEMLEKYGILTTIHMDPIDLNDEQIPLLKEKVDKIVKKIDPSYSIHDFRLVKGAKQTKLVFDVLLPPDDIVSHEKIKKEISDEISAIDPHYICVIQVDHPFG